MASLDVLDVKCSRLSESGCEAQYCAVKLKHVTHQMWENTRASADTLVEDDKSLLMFCHDAGGEVKLYIGDPEEGACETIW